MKSVFGNINYSDKISEALRSAEFSEGPTNLYQPIEYILSLAGKRIRPQLVLLAADLFGVEHIEEAIPVSIAVEYFHNFSLIHDDIMDKAPLRRGQLTVHQKWNNSIAILSGDALLVKAYEQLSLCPAQLIPSLLKIFNRIALEVCEGQQYDMDFEDKDSIQQKDYIEMIRQKTSVLLGGALEMGAVIAGAPQVERTKIYNFGVHLGIAFQLQDDILDAYGDPKAFGKQVGGDIIVNKKTILHVLLREALEPEDESYFLSILSLTENDTIAKVEEMKNLYEKYNVLEKANALKRHYTSLAFNNLDSIEVDAANKTDLFELANLLMHRVQ